MKHRCQRFHSIASGKTPKCKCLRCFCGPGFSTSAVTQRLSQCWAPVSGVVDVTDLGVYYVLLWFGSAGGEIGFFVCHPTAKMDSFLDNLESKLYILPKERSSRCPHQFPFPIAHSFVFEAPPQLHGNFSTSPLRWLVTAPCVVLSHSGPSLYVVANRPVYDMRQSCWLGSFLPLPLL